MTTVNVDNKKKRNLRTMAGKPLTQAQCVGLAIGVASLSRPVVLARPFTMGHVELYPVGEKSKETLLALYPEGAAHLYSQRGGLLVEQRYVDGTVARLRAHGVLVP